MTAHKPRPIHEIRPTPHTHTGLVAFTWCLVDPYRKGVQTNIVPGNVPNCVACAKAKAVKGAT